MKKVALLIGAMFLVGIADGGQLFYAADFSSPLNQVGQPPTTGDSPSTPSLIIFGSPTVVSSFGQLTNQPLLFEAIGYQQIGFDLSKGAPDYFLDFDFESHNLNSSLFLFMTIFDCPEVESFNLHGIGYIEIPDYSFLPGWTDDEAHHMHIEMNAVNRTWKLKVDGRPTVSGGYYHSSGPDVLSLRMGILPWRWGTPDDPNVQIAIDNIRIGTSLAANPPTLTCPNPLVVECGDGPTDITVNVEDSSTDQLEIVWTINGIPCQTNMLAEGMAITPVALNLSAEFPLGTNVVGVLASNGESTPAECSTLVTLRDTIPPAITRIAATPGVLWPPNGKLVAVRIDVESKDQCGSTKSRIIGVRCNEPAKDDGKNQTGDWQVTSDLTVNLRATRSGNGSGRVYTILVESADESGNVSHGVATVTVAENQSSAK